MAEKKKTSSKLVQPEEDYDIFHADVTDDALTFAFKGLGFSSFSSSSSSSSSTSSSSSSSYATSQLSNYETQERKKVVLKEGQHVEAEQDAEKKEGKKKRRKRVPLLLGSMVKDCETSYEKYRYPVGTVAHITSNGNYHEIYINLPLPGTQKPQKNVVFFLVECSGTMLRDEKTRMSHLIPQLEIMIDKCLQENHEVYIIWWALDSSIFRVTRRHPTRYEETQTEQDKKDAKTQVNLLEDKLDLNNDRFKKLSDCVNPEFVNNVIRYGQAELNSDFFSERNWEQASFPRMGLQRMRVEIEKLMNKGANIGSLTCYMFVDGPFPSFEDVKKEAPEYENRTLDGPVLIKGPDDEATTENFLLNYKKFVDRWSFPKKFVMITLDEDLKQTAPDDVYSLMSLFDRANSHYLNIPNPFVVNEHVTQLLEFLPERIQYDRIDLMIDGKLKQLVVGDEGSKIKAVLCQPPPFVKSSLDQERTKIKLVDREKPLVNPYFYLRKRVYYHCFQPLKQFQKQVKNKKYVNEHISHFFKMEELLIQYQIDQEKILEQHKGKFQLELDRTRSFIFNMMHLFESILSSLFYFRRDYDANPSQLISQKAKQYHLDEQKTTPEEQKEAAAAAQESERAALVGSLILRHARTEHYYNVSVNSIINSTDQTVYIITTLNSAMNRFSPFYNEKKAQLLETKRNSTQKPKEVDLDKKMQQLVLHSKPDEAPQTIQEYMRDFRKEYVRNGGETREDEHGNKRIICELPEEVFNEMGKNSFSNEPWRNIYARGDTKLICFIMPKKPTIEQIHNPSTIKLIFSRAHVSLEQLDDMLERRIIVKGYDSLFEHFSSREKTSSVGPFEDEESGETFTFGLPTWTANLETVFHNQRMQRVLAQTITGHPRAIPVRYQDLFISGILCVLELYLEHYSSYLLETLMKLIMAFRRVCKWSRHGNSVNPNRDSPKAILDLFMTGHTTEDAFPNLFEVIIYALTEPRRKYKLDDFRALFQAELIYRHLGFSVAHETQKIVTDYVVKNHLIEKISYQQLMRCQTLEDMEEKTKIKMSISPVHMKRICSHNRALMKDLDLLKKCLKLIDVFSFLRTNQIPAWNYVVMEYVLWEKNGFGLNDVVAQFVRDGIRDKKYVDEDILNEDERIQVPYSDLTKSFGVASSVKAEEKKTKNATVEVVADEKENMNKTNGGGGKTEDEKKQVKMEKKEAKQEVKDPPDEEKVPFVASYEKGSDFYGMTSKEFIVSLIESVRFPKIGDRINRFSRKIANGEQHLLLRISQAWWALASENKNASFLKQIRDDYTQNHAGFPIRFTMETRDWFTDVMKNACSYPKHEQPELNEIGCRSFLSEFKRTIFSQFADLEYKCHKMRFPGMNAEKRPQTNRKRFDLLVDSRIEALWDKRHQYDWTFEYDSDGVPLNRCSHILCDQFMLPHYGQSSEQQDGKETEYQKKEHYAGEGYDLPKCEASGSPSEIPRQENKKPNPFRIGVENWISFIKQLLKKHRDSTSQAFRHEMIEYLHSQIIDTYHPKYIAYVDSLRDFDI